MLFGHKHRYIKVLSIQKTPAHVSFASLNAPILVSVKSNWPPLQESVVLATHWVWNIGAKASITGFQR